MRDEALSSLEFEGLKGYFGSFQFGKRLGCNWDRTSIL